MLKKEKEHQSYETPSAALIRRYGKRPIQHHAIIPEMLLSVQHHIIIPEMGSMISTHIWVNILQPVWANPHLRAPLGTHYGAGLPRLLGSKLEGRKGIALAEHDYSMELLMRAKIISIHFKHSSSPLFCVLDKLVQNTKITPNQQCTPSKSATVLCQIIQKED